MRSSKKIYDDIIEVYNALYAAAVPSASFDELSANCTVYEDEHYKEIITDAPLSTDEMEIRGLKKKINFYAYWVPQDKFQEIVEGIMKKHRYKSGSYEANGFRMHAYLGCGPTSSVDRWLESNPQYTYDDFVRMATEAGYTDLPTPKGCLNNEEEKQYC